MNKPSVYWDKEIAWSLWQATTLQDRLAELGMESTLVPLKSQGDLDLQQPLYAMGVTGIFTKALDSALLNQEIDLAIHSMKDVPTQLPKGIVQAAVLERGPVEDVIMWKNTTAKEKDHRVIATEAARKAWRQRKYAKDKIVDPRGNIQTRLENLQNDWRGPYLPPLP